MIRWNRIGIAFTILGFIFLIGRSDAQDTFQSKRLDALLERHGWIKVGLEDAISQAEITLPAGGIIYLGSNAASKCNAGTIQLVSSKGNVTLEFPGETAPTMASDVLIVPAGESFQFEGRSYRGRARVIGGRQLTVINDVMIDDWLKGVLPAEIGSDSPLEALKAQAVAARSEAIFRLSHPPHDDEGYDFCTGVHCQAYKGIGEETPEIRRACDATLGYVLIADGGIVNAVYHNVCGGVTAGAEDVWDSDPIPGLSPVFDTPQEGTPNLATEAAAAQFIQSDGADCFCYPGNPEYAEYAKKYFRWSKNLSASEAGSMAGVGTLTDIRVTERRPSGRVRKLLVTGTGGSKTIEKELPIRHVFDLWSGLFILKTTNSGGHLSSVTFVGAGNGHGVGLCQHGAREIARRGGTFDQILAHYYSGAKLKKIYRP